MGKYVKGKYRSNGSMIFVNALREVLGLGPLPGSPKRAEVGWADNLQISTRRYLLGEGKAKHVPKDKYSK